MIVGKLTLKAMSRKFGNVKSVPQKHANKAAVNDRRIIKGWASELFHHKVIGEKVREGYNKAAGEPEYNLNKWFWEFMESPIPITPKKEILQHLQRFEHGNGFIIGKLLRACWVDVEVGIAEVPYKLIYPDYN